MDKTEYLENFGIGEYTSITDTDAHTGNHKGFIVTEEATITALKDLGGTTIDCFTGAVFPVGTYIVPFSSIQLTSGKAYAFRISPSLL